LAALNAAGLSAVHIPEEYGGQGGDAVAGCIVIEEVARVCASSSMIPVANKLGTMGIVLQGSDDLRKQVFPSLASGRRWRPTGSPSAKPPVASRRTTAARCRSASACG
jgi:alkylation response protein AidB-like acyl-CoA dehydrogenase